MRVSITIFCISYMNKMFSEFIRSNLQRDINIIRIDYEYVCTCMCFVSEYVCGCDGNLCI